MKKAKLYDLSPFDALRLAQQHAGGTDEEARREARAMMSDKDKVFVLLHQSDIIVSYLQTADEQKMEVDEAADIKPDVADIDVDGLPNMAEFERAGDYKLRDYTDEQLRAGGDLQEQLDALNALLHRAAVKLDKLKHNDDEVIHEYERRVSSKAS